MKGDSPERDFGRAYSWWNLCVESEVEWLFENFLLLFCSWIALQGLLWTSRRSSDGEEETATHPDDFHLCSAQRIGKGLSGDALSRHLHQGGDCHEDWPDRGQSAGERAGWCSSLFPPKRKVDVRMTHGLALTTVRTALMDTTFQLGYLGNGYQF